MPLMSTPCRACNDPGVICTRHPPDAFPLPNPFYHPNPYIHRSYPNPNPFSITMQAPPYMSYPQAPPPSIREGASESNPRFSSSGMDSNATGSTRPFDGAYMLPMLHPFPAPPIPPSPSTQRSNPQPNKRKTGTGPMAGRPRKAPKRTQGPAPLATTAGIGPSIRHSTTTHHLTESSVLSHPVPPTYVVRGPTIKSNKDIKDLATELPSKPDEIESAKEERARRVVEILPEDLRRPDDTYSRLLCLHCLCLLGKWKTWVNGSGGVTDGIRTHMEKYHAKDYLSGLRSIGSNRVNKAQVGDESSPDDIAGEAITPEGLTRYIAELVADQDLAKTFRRLLCYVGQGNIQASDIPERRAVAKVSSDLSQEEKEHIKEDMQLSQGRVSLTSDLWTDEMERPFMAVTGHYINSIKEIRTTLMAFRVVEGAHAGIILAQHLFGVLKEYDVIHKVGSVTLDNASNNNTMMEELARLIRAEGYDFDKEGNRIRCFPHIINLAVTAFMDALGYTGGEYLDDRIKANNPPSEASMNYLSALKQRPDKKCRNIVVALRKGQRRVAFRQTILEGNDRGHFKQVQVKKVPGPDGELIDTKMEVIIILRVLELILDVPTRWSSTRSMLDRFVEEYPAVWEYLNKNKEIFSDLIMSDLEFKVLQDILVCLNVPHSAQELLSAEQTPSLSLAFPVYDQLIYSWRQVGKRLGPYEYAIECGVAKIEEYVARSRSSPIHIIAMVMNPCIKYTYVDARWTPVSMTMNARVVMKNFILQHLEAREQRSAIIGPEDLSTKASQAQGRGINNLFLESGGHCYDNEFSFTPSQTPEAPSRVQPTPQRSLFSAIASSPYSNSPARATSLHRNLIVEAEHDRYVKEKLVPLSELGKIDLVKHWTRAEEKFSLLHAVAMDVLPAQASSVSSERVFSSSKLTCTRARNRMKANTVESLQILKYALRNRYKTLAARNSNEIGNTTIETQSPGRDSSDEVNVSPMLDLMSRLGDVDWSHDAILDTDCDLAP
ncbi:hypothetical protein RSAG8_09424, partial [Rhizoctonia solani AG-8 WAC10335]